ncbi:MAG: DUF4942 domain-containing protein [Lysobacteraceae bacterium]
MNSSEIRTQTTARRLLEKRNQALDKVQQAVALLEQVQASLGLRKCALTGDYSFKPAELLARFEQKADEKCWNDLMIASGLFDLMDDETRKAWDASFDNGPGCSGVASFEAETVESTFTDLFKKKDTMLEQAIVDCFERLFRHRWRSSLSQEENKRREGPKPLTPKFRIDDFAMPADSWGSGSFFCGFEALKRLIVLMCVIEGRRDGSKAAELFLDECLRWRVRGERKAKCEFFEVRWFKNGRAEVLMNPEHMDTADRLNAVVSKRYPGLFPALESGGK